MERSELVSNGEDATPAPPPPPTTSGAHDIQLPENNYKAILNEYCQKHYLALPEYTTEYPENSTGYIAVVTVCESEYRSTPHMAKKKAEQNAAGRAALELGLVKAEGREEGGGGGGGGGYRSPLGQSFTPRAAPDVESKPFKVVVCTRIVLTIFTCVCAFLPFSCAHACDPLLRQCCMIVYTLYTPFRVKLRFL